MNRLRQRHVEVVAATLARYVPDRMHEYVECDLFCEDAPFAGICSPAGSVDTTTDGRSYHDVAHVLWPYHARDRRTTVVVPGGAPAEATVIHELGHVLHWRLFERTARWDAIPRLEPVTAYARTSPWEEFAEAWTAWHYAPGQVERRADYWTHWSRSNDEFFDRLFRA